MKGTIGKAEKGRARGKSLKNSPVLKLHIIHAGGGAGNSPAVVLRIVYRNANQNKS
jgi:hypothetical protein